MLNADAETRVTNIGGFSGALLRLDHLIGDGGLRARRQRAGEDPLQRALRARRGMLTL
jgi:hypothetical protein